MAHELLGERFDIHGGGNDLMFPHHENEIAQSKCMGHGFANVWLHNEMLQVEGKKMSKSLGNFFTVRNLLDQGWPGEVIRFVMLSTHYRKPMDWTEKKAREAERTLAQWHRHASLALGLGGVGEPPAPVIDALKNDLNTPLAISETHKLASQGNAVGVLKAMQFLGLSTSEMPGWSLNNIGYPIQNVMDQLEAKLTEYRRRALENKDFSVFDDLRKKVNRAGFEVRITKASIKIDPTPESNIAALEALK
jgi:cysteinyl-tRNA synthetase